ncbi:S-adenosyl-L-methionine-dependent methyltransferase [Irpex lacteus]|nr:S-adenosyl-L-methionine-dependent methyltransferase [Irpex lacteus]
MWRLHKRNSASATNKELVDLGNLVTSSLDAIIKTCGTQKFPSAHEPFSPESEALRMNPDIQAQSAILVAAATQLVAAIRPPPVALLIHGLTYYIPACIRAVIEVHVAEIIRGSQGMHVKDIAAPTNTDPAKLARVLRLLVSNYIFREVAPDTFAHNRVSSILDTGKSIEDILADPQGKYDKSMGVSALLEHFADEGLKGSGYIADVLKDPKFAHSDEPTETAFNSALKTDLPLFDWLELPENAYRRRRFGNAMEGARSVVPPDGVIKGEYMILYVMLYSLTMYIPGFDWKSLPKDSLVVDVGGGFGTETLNLAKAFSHLKFVVQDQVNVIDDAPKYWEAHFPEAVSSGRVQLQAHNFFDEQPVKSPAVFYLRMILHDWSDEYCLKILRRLRAAAGPNTKLVVADKIVSYACEEPQSVKDIQGGTLPSAPAPLLPNYGAASTLIYLSDINMLSSLNGAERTLASFKDLYERSGWRLAEVGEYALLSAADPKIIGVPA